MSNELKDMDQNLLSKIKDYVHDKYDNSSITSVDILFEFLQECEILDYELLEGTRWYDFQENIAKLNNNFFVKFDTYHMTGDANMRDMGLEYDIDSIVEVEPKKVTTIKYIKKEYE